MSEIKDVYFYIPPYGMKDYEFLMSITEGHLNLDMIPKRPKYRDVWIRCVEHGDPAPKL